MLNFKEELKTHEITLKQVAENASVPFCDVYKFSSGAFVYVSDEVQFKIVSALSTLTNHRYTRSDFVYHPSLPADIPIPTPVVIPLGARGGQQSVPLVKELKRNAGIETWAMTTNASHRPKPSTRQG